MRNVLFALCLAASSVTAFAAAPAAKHTFEIGENDFLLDGQRLQIRCGEIHAARVPNEYWRHRLKMCKAMGLNAVCAYLFWNFHEPVQGQFNWEGDADIARFCKIAQEEGLWVILRPGPYACAEWEMGGLPWWLLKHEKISLRSRDAKYLEPAKAYLKDVGRVLAPLQVTRGGPILMVQAENEYGFYGGDAAYMGEIRQALLDAGFDVPLFACNPGNQLRNGFRDDLFAVVNFGADPKWGFGKLREVQKTGPLMCGEFYPGWFDTWGKGHREASWTYLRDLEIMTKMGASYSIYMAHGGTTFGMWAGCDGPFMPDTSSYDYSAPISEAGWVTPNFHKTRELLGQYLLPGETLPEIPAPLPVFSFAALKPTGAATLFDNLPKPRKEETPRNMEAYDQGFGCILYRTTLPPGPAALLSAANVKDFGFVYLDGKPVDGLFDRRRGGKSLMLPKRDKAMRLDILVEPMGRVNFGQGIHDRKGLHAPVLLAGKELTGWDVFNLPMDNTAKLGFKNAAPAKGNPAFWSFSLDVKDPADTFLDMRPWGKGLIWVNGRCLARYWNIGPTQTAYLPGCWLKKGKNTIVIWDITGPSEPLLAGLDKPILNKLRPELDFAPVHKRPAVTWNLAQPVKTGAFEKGKSTQTVKLDKPAKGRVVCLETLTSHDGHAFAAVSEIDFFDAAGEIINHDGWTIAGVSSEETGGENGAAENAIDGQTANHWHTQWQSATPKHPHRLAIDLGKEQTVTGFRYVPRQNDTRGWIKEYRFYVGNDLVKPDVKK